MACPTPTSRPPYDTRRMTQRAGWLRPYTRWAAGVAYQAPAWLGPLRLLPLKVSTLLLRLLK